jgi:hypothetical protein
VLPLPRASPAGTRQRLSLYRVPPNTLGKGTSKEVHRELLCRGPVQKTLGKEGAFTECHRRTQQSFRHYHLTLWWQLFFAENHVALGKVFADCSTKSIRQRNRCWCIVRWDFFAEYHTRQRLCQVFTRHSAKQLCPVVTLDISTARIVLYMIHLAKTLLNHTHPRPTEILNVFEGTIYVG